MDTNQITRFDFHGATVRVITDEHNETWFIAKDICDVLGIDTNHAREGLDDDEITNLRNTEVWNRPGRAPLIVSEAGFYRLVLRSRKPVAKEFQRWVTHEVLPSIRKHGGYMAGQEGMSPEQMLAASMRWLESRIAEQQGQIASQQAQLDAQAPKVLFADAVSTSKRCILVGELAKILRQNGVDMGEKRLFAWLREHGYLMQRNGVRNFPTQRSMDLGLFKVKETPIVHSDGHTTLSVTTKVTPKGQQYFIQKFLGHKEQTK
jgi:anti-repressor protein